MSLDLDFLNEITGKSDETVDPKDWKPKAGNNLIRLLPDDNGRPIKKAEIHFNLGREAFLCPKMFGEQCPACDFGWNLYNEDKNDPKKTFKNFLPTKYYICNIVARDEEDWQLPRLARINQKVVDVLVEHMRDPDYGDITDVDAGHDITLMYDEAAAKNRQNSLSVKFKPVKTKLAPTKKEVQEILANRLDPYDKYPRKSTAEIFEILQNFSETSSGSDNSNTNDVETRGSTESAKSGVDLSFDELKAKLAK